MMAVNRSTPSIPRLLIVKVPPLSSAGFSLLALARALRSAISAPSAASPFLPASWTTGTINPSSRATAIPMLASGIRRIWLLARSSWLLIRGWRASAQAQALAITAVTLIRAAPSGRRAFARARSASSALTSMSASNVICGASWALFCSRRAMVLRIPLKGRVLIAIGAGAASTTGAGRGAAATFAAAATAATETSPAWTRPRGPLPATSVRSTPSARAALRAAGVARGLPAAAASTSWRVIFERGPLPAMLARSTPRSLATAWAIGVAWISVCGATGAGEETGAFSPGPRITAMTWVTSTVSPSAARTSASTPVAGASISMLVLSVVISTMGSPWVTASPARLSQRTMLPSSMVKPSFGMMTSFIV